MFPLNKYSYNLLQLAVYSKELIKAKSINFARHNSVAVPFRLSSCAVSTI